MSENEMPHSSRDEGWGTNEKIGQTMGLLGTGYYLSCRTRVGHGAMAKAAAGLRRLGALRGFRIYVDALALNHACVRGLMQLWPRIHWSSGDGMMPPEQLLTVYRLAAGWPAEGATVELGSWVGLTTCYLATACRVRGRGRVYAVDTFEGTKEGGTRYPSVAGFGGSTLSAFQDRVRRAGVSDWVEVLVGDTVSVLRDYDGGPIRFLLIDADHSYEGVRRDFEHWSPLVLPGGLIVFHDYLAADVARFVDTHVRSDVRFTFHPGHVVPNVMAVTKDRRAEASVASARVSEGSGRS